MSQNPVPNVNTWELAGGAVILYTKEAAFPGPNCMKSDLLAFLVCCAAVAVGAAQETPKVQLTARELFYSAAQAPPPAPAASVPKTAGKKKGATHTATQGKSAAPAPSASPAARPAPPESAAASTPARSDDTRIVTVSARTTAPAPTEGPALGLRYTILRRSGEDMVPVAPDTVFHSGDRIQFNVETNGPGYLYIVSQGSSGTWKPMFPSPDVEDGDNHVEGFRAYTMPPKSRLVFDEQAGTEKLFIVFSRQPEPNFENTIYSLQPAKPQPAAQPDPAARPKKLLVASIDDGTVGRLRNTYSRDLIIEKVDESTPGDTKEKAMYVVNPTGSQDSRVVADLRLVHK